MFFRRASTARPTIRRSLLALAVCGVTFQATAATAIAPSALPIGQGAVATQQARRSDAMVYGTNNLTWTGRTPASTANEPSGNFRFLCNFSHMAYDDPIVYPGQPGASHLHTFFGNTSANAFSTYDSLRVNGGSTCQGGILNRSAYWAPALLDNTSKVVLPDYAAVYYKANGTRTTIPQVRSYPNALKMIAGYNMAAPGGATHFDWQCEFGSTKSQTIPNCPTGQRIGVVIRFPSCWDGKNVDSADHRSHMSYTVGHDFSGVCPGTHPIHVPEYTVGLWYPNGGGSANWYLDSDRMPGMTHANGTTFHADWFGAWDPATQDTWVRECIDAMRDCKEGEIGNGWKLTHNGVWPDAPHIGPPTVERPPKP